MKKRGPINDPWETLMFQCTQVREKILSSITRSYLNFVLILARSELKDIFATATVPLTAVVPNRQVFLPEPEHLHFVLAKGLRSYSLYSCVLHCLIFRLYVCMYLLTLKTLN